MDGQVIGVLAAVTFGVGVVLLIAVHVVPHYLRRGVRDGSLSEAAYEEQIAFGDRLRPWVHRWFLVPALLLVAHLLAG